MQRNSADTIPADAEGGENARAKDASWYAEALFFAYREFTGEPDRILNEFRFGRAHHRVLFFVDRYPGLRVADLLEILQITKQSLSRVLRELVERDFVLQEAGRSDKRERLLHLTEKGRDLTNRLAAPQLKMLKAGLEAAGASGPEAVARFLDAMIGNAKDLPHNRINERSGFDDEMR
jgi:DNA-binding MarR family transcriptional regulator